MPAAREHRRLRGGVGILLLLAWTAVGCSKAINYLDASTPLHTYARAGTAATIPMRGPWRVVSFNIAYALEIERAIEVLRESEPLRGADIIALQEMDAPGTERVARALGMNAVYFPSGVHPKYRRDFGCAILSPWRLEDPRKVILPHGARVTGLRRSATSAIVVRGNERIRVYSVHLPSPAAISGGDRRDELRVLAQDAAGEEPVVIAGDFNSYGKVAELEKAGFDWVTRDLGGTVAFRLLGLRIRNLPYDHVLVRGLRRASMPDSMGAAKNRNASDHLPIWVVLTLAESPVPN